MGKRLRLCTTAWEWDGKVGNHLVDGTGLHEISWWDGKDGIEERVGNIVVKSIGNIVGKSVENIGKLNPVGNGWEHDDR